MESDLNYRNNATGHQKASRQKIPAGPVPGSASPVEAERAALAQIDAEIQRLEERFTRSVLRGERIKRVAENLRGGKAVSDLWFDQVYPKEIRELSGTHWTPVRVARRAAELLSVGHEYTRILDVGSGAGKFCIVGALSIPDAEFVGIEQRPHLVETSTSAARTLGALRASFIQGNMAGLDWNDFGAFYLYNPFYEHRHPTMQLDQTIPFSEECFERYVRTVRAKLRQARVGARVVTYHGFGGEMPVGYRCVAREPAGTSMLELWINRAVLRYGT